MRELPFALSNKELSILLSCQSTTAWTMPNQLLTVVSVHTQYVHNNKGQGLS